MALTPKKARFVEEYLVDLNATGAAIRAGYTKTNASQMGHNLLQEPEVKAAIKEGKAKISERTKVTQDYVIQKLKKIAEMEAGDNASYRVRVGNQIRALELLGRHVGLFDPKSTSAHPETEDDPLTASLKEWMKENGTQGDI
jgi:phage terminase small subunit